MRMEDHPTVKWFLDQPRSPVTTGHALLDANELSELCLALGADDVGFVELHRPALADQVQDLLTLLPESKTVASLVFRVGREALRSMAHSVTNLEFRRAWDSANRTARSIAAALEKRGISALNPPVGFPFAMERWPGKVWLTCDKIIAAEAGMGHMGWNRLVIHPVFGSSVLLGTLLIDRELSAYAQPLRDNPCIGCKLCVSVCPVGAVGADGYFDFFSCYTHNYRERLGGFSAWVDNLVESKSRREYRKRVSDAETLSMWQNLSIASQTRCDRCMAVCPAGRQPIGEYLTDRAGYAERTVKKMRDKPETVYVVAGSDAESHVTSKFPAKTAKRVSNGLRPSSTNAFLRRLPMVFQRNQSAGLNATFHFTFTGAEPCVGTVVIENKTIRVQEGHEGSADLHLIADSATWLGFLAKERNLLWAIVTRKIRVKGSQRLMGAFAKCFPS
jgi:ferredoxin